MFTVRPQCHNLGRRSARSGRSLTPSSLLLTVLRRWFWANSYLKFIKYVFYVVFVANYLYVSFKDRTEYKRPHTSGSTKLI